VKYTVYKKFSASRTNCGRLPKDGTYSSTGLAEPYLMRRFVKLLPVFILFLLLGCSKFQGINILRPGLPTVTKAVLTAIKAPILPSETPSIETAVTATETAETTPIVLTIDPTYLVFPTKTPTPTVDPGESLLRIVSPGQMSKVVSPIEFIVHVAPEYTGSTHIELIGEDGAELYRKVFKTFSNIGYYTRVDEKIEYEIQGTAEIARLQVSTFDTHGRMQAFNSVRLLLQAVGENEFTPESVIQDRTVLRFPKNGNEISGGSLPIDGEFQPANNLPIILELIAPDGKVLGSRLLQLGAPDGKYQQFITSIPYQVTTRTTARLVVRQSDDRIDGLAYLYSEPVVLIP
jgi:hypothetical protein